jgi:MoaA/NifB/PqqE/SkfB family radical SAM enzyme
MRRFLVRAANLLLASFGKRIPLVVKHMATFRCNLRCEYCGLWKTKRNEMTTEQVRSAMDEFAGMGTISWNFTGGEPLMREDIGELVRHARSKGFKTTMVTNGTLVRKRLNDVKELNLIQISIDGPEEINDRIRGKGSYRKAFEGLLAAKDVGVPVRIAATVSEENAADGCAGLEFIIDQAKSIGCEIIIQPVYRDSWNRAEELNRETLLSVIGFLERERYPKLIVPRPYLSWIRRFLDGKKLRCSSGRSVVQLFPDGKLAPCYFMEHRSIDGIETGFRDAFNRLDFPDKCACLYLCYLEFAFAMSMNPFSALDYIRRYRYMR